MLKPLIGNMADSRTIPIFPLNLVLFPRQKLPLRKFEPRYKQLIDDCMVSDSQFGICLADESKKIQGWEAPRMVGTMAKITKCEDVEMGMQLFVDTIGRHKFKINEIIPPSMKLPDNYDPYTVEGHKKISDMQEKIGLDRKMYISANVEFLPDIDEPVPIDVWKNLVDLWKQRIIYQALPQIVNPFQLDQVLQQYSLTETPTIDYLYSLVSLGATDPNMIQPILEAESMDEVILEIEELFMIK